MDLEASPRFTCNRCGTCCTHLRGRWDHDGARFRALPEVGIYRLDPPGGLRFLPWETAPFEAYRERWNPLLVVADARRERLVTLVHELEATRCPRYDDEAGCTVYAERPLVCRAFPLLVAPGEAGGPEVAASATCPARVSLAGAQLADPEAELHHRYPGEAPAALATPVLVQLLTDLVAFLEAADVLEPVAGLDGAAVAGLAELGALDLLDVAEASGAMTRQEVLERARARVARALGGEAAAKLVPARDRSIGST